ncbi:MAG: hypothetical protein M3229_05440, partial [Actinomycetota bacterium]|nr:hypothetical protein [Actinomycetota bacterium]
WERVYEDRGAQHAHALLAERDPAAAAAVHPNDRRRVVRALELTELGASLRPSDPRLWTNETRHPTLIFGLDLAKKELDRLIEERARTLVAAGAVDEARRAAAGRLSETARHIHGLRDFAELPLEEALDALIARTRRFAAYQRKWMRRIPGLVTVEANRRPGDIADEILEVARARQHVRTRRAG